jgi:hypothetical protein
MTMFERLLKWWRKPDGSAPVAKEQITAPVPEVVPEAPAHVSAPLPIKPVMPPTGNPKRIYASAADRQRAFRERQKAAVAAKDETFGETSQTVAPESILPTVPLDGLQALRTAGSAAILPVVEPIEALSIAVEPTDAALQATAAEPAVEIGIAESAAPIEPEPWIPDWAREARTDLPMRSVDDIRLLLTVETESQTIARIENDRVRYARQRYRQTAPNQQGAISHVRESSSVTEWVKR